MMKLVKQIDLLLKEISDSYTRENFSRIKTFIDSLFTVALGKDRANSMEDGSSILFPEITDTNIKVGMLRVPSLKGAPTAKPLTTGEGFVVWDSTNNKLYVWDGSTWQAMN